MERRDSQLGGSRRSLDRESQASSQVHGLMERLERISSSIQIDTNSKAFKFLESPTRPFREDPHTLLRNLENRSEINRAEVELISQRRPKHYSIKPSRQPDQQDTYLSLYRRLRQEKVFKEKNDTELTSEEEMLQGGEEMGVRHFSQLRQHPRLLQYTLQRIRDKSPEHKLQSRKQEAKETLRSASKPAALQLNEEFKEIIEGEAGLKVDALASPKAIVENQLAKFYSKSSKGKLDVRIKDNPRCARLLERQEQLVTRLDDQSISKENMKKLKERLNVILNEISRNDKPPSDRHGKLPAIPSPFPSD